MDIAKYIGETTEYDKKQEVERRKVKSWLKSVSAFANGGGGCLLFGIADDDLENAIYAKIQRLKHRMNKTEYAFDSNGNVWKL